MGIVEQKFQEWTRELTPLESRIIIFNNVRDIPYIIDPTLWDLEAGPVKMLQIGKGSCTPKHYLMGSLFQDLGLKVKFCTYPFKWKELDIEYPSEIKILAEKLPIAYHLACKVLIKNKWVLVDATWDTGLRGIGFPVNDVWDGESDTVLAVKSDEEFDYDDARERDIVFKADMSVYSLPEKLQLSRFSIALNKWLETVRS